MRKYHGAASKIKVFVRVKLLYGPSSFPADRSNAVTLCSSYLFITKARLFKYTEIFTTKKP